MRVFARWQPGYDDEEEAVGRLSPADVETLVEKYLHSRRRADELESENAKLTQQLMAISLSEQCKDTVRTSRQPRVPPARDSHDATPANAQADGPPLLFGTRCAQLVIHVSPEMW